VIAVAAVVATVAVATLGRSRGGRDRLVDVLPLRGGSPTAAPAAPGRLTPARRTLAAAVAVVCGVVAVGGMAGLLVGALGAGVVGLVRFSPRPVRVNPDDLAVVIDLIAGCLSAGATLPAALDAATQAADGVLREACKSVAGALRSGAPAEQAWSHWLADPFLGPIARTAIRTATSGAATAEELRRASLRVRARRRAGAAHRIRQASVWLVAPLGLCFLPAFVLLAVVPMVVGLAPTFR
jgi:Flp pilus assembly protein TadB